MSFWDFVVVLLFLEFWEFVRNQEACRKRWFESQTAVDCLKASIADKENENVALQTKLKHARFVLCLNILVSSFKAVGWTELHPLWSFTALVLGLFGQFEGPKWQRPEVAAHHLTDGTDIKQNLQKVEPLESI